jgi:hypothetical protein
MANAAPLEPFPFIGAFATNTQLLPELPYIFLHFLQEGCPLIPYRYPSRGMVPLIPDFLPTGSH